MTGLLSPFCICINSQVIKCQTKQILSYLCLQATREGQASYAHVHEIIKGLEQRGWNVRLYEPRYRTWSKQPGPFGRLLEFAFIQLRLFLSEKPDVVYIRWHFASFPAAFWARLCRIPVIQEVNGPYEDLFIAWPLSRRFAWFFKWLLRTQLRWADAVISVTQELADWCKSESGNNNVFVVPNGANTELFRPDAPLSVSLPEHFVVFFGALAPWQGIETLLKALDEKEWPGDVKLVIVGDGAERFRVEDAARNGKVIYLGTIPYKQMAGIVARSIAGLSPQNSAGGRSSTGLNPLKVFETLACGVPVVVTDFPGQADLVREGNCGIVIPPEDPGALARAVAYLYNHPHERALMGCRGRALVEKKHSWNRRAEQTDHILRKL